MTRKLIATLTVLAMMTAAGLSAATTQHSESGTERGWHRSHAGMRPDFSGDPARMVEMMNRHLDLNETQSQTIGNILQATRPEADSIRERSRANQEALRTLDVNDANYDTTLQNLSAESGELATERTLLHGRVRGEILAVLTAEQQKKMADRGGRMRSQRGHHSHDETPE